MHSAELTLSNNSYIRNVTSEIALIIFQSTRAMPGGVRAAKVC